MRNTFQAIALLKSASRTLCGVGLQTYGRKPHEMRETTQWQKLQMAERECRKANALIDDALKALGEGLSPDLSFRINKYSPEKYEAVARFVETHFTPDRDTRGDSDGDDGA